MHPEIDARNRKAYDASMKDNSPSQWSIGQKVICIDDSFPRAVWKRCNSVPVAGYIYTIRAMEVGTDPTRGVRNLGFLLAEILNPRNDLGFEAGFIHTRFVPWLDVCSEAEHIDAVEPLQLQDAK